MRQRSGVPWGKIAILACASFVIGADGFMLAAVLTQVAEQLGVSVGQTGLLVTVFAWVYAIFAPLSGMLMSRCNRRTSLAAPINPWPPVGGFHKSPGETAAACDDSGLYGWYGCDVVP